MGLLVDEATESEDRGVGAHLTCLRGDEADGGVQVLVVVPAHEAGVWRRAERRRRLHDRGDGLRAERVHPHGALTLERKRQNAIAASLPPSLFDGADKQRSGEVALYSETEEAMRHLLDGL